MLKSHLILSFLVIFLLLALILKFVGVINIGYSELIGYLLIFFGVGTVYASMGMNKKKFLFAGTVSFFIGVLLFVNSNYELIKISYILLPSLFFILGSAFLIIFFDDSSSKLTLIISLIFFVSGFFFFAKLGTFSVSDFLKSALSITIKYWPIVIILTAIILLLKKNQRS